MGTMAQIPYFLRNPALEGMQDIPFDQQPPALAKVFADGAAQGASPSQKSSHLVHTLDTADGMGGPVSPASPQVTLDPNPQHQIEGHLTNQLQRAYEKEAQPKGVMGKIGDTLANVLNIHPIRERTADLESRLNDVIGKETANEATHAEIPLRQAQTEQALGRASQAEGANDTKEDIATQHNKTLEDIASMHQATQRAFQHVAGKSGGKDLFANYDPSKGVFTDLTGNVLTDFKPKDKAMQGAYGAYGPMRLAGQLLNYASNDNPALLHVLAPVISHMIAGAPGGGNATEMQSILSQAPASQPQDESGNPIGLKMPGAPTGATRSRGQFAEAIIPSITTAQTQIKNLANDLGPMAGRYNELATSKVGAYGPEFAELQTTLHNVATAWMRLHANSESARQDFVNQLKAAQSPENLIAVLDSIDKQAKDYVKQGKGRGGQEGATPPAGAKIIKWEDVK